MSSNEPTAWQVFGCITALCSGCLVVCLLGGIALGIFTLAVKFFWTLI